MGQFVTAAALLAVGLFVPSVDAECSLSCIKDSVPVCAHCPLKGYKNFKDRCALENANYCGGEDWVPIHPGECIPVEIRGCPPKFQPVCGISPGGYKSFINKCYLEIEAYYTDFKFAHDGACCSTEVPPSKCPGVCTKEYNPVCGYSPTKGYYTFSNNCLLKKENECNYGTYTPKHNGECTDKELAYNCKLRCKDEKYPLCGRSEEKGFKTFDNLCKLEYENACLHTDYKVVHDGPCTPPELGSFCKPGFCPDTREPVCASRLPYYRTFRNKCLFYVENSCKFGDFKFLHDGECTEKEREQSCKTVCPAIDAPVCSYSPYRGYKTFRSGCLVNYDNACYGTDYGTVHFGECKKEELELICTKEYCTKFKKEKVCGLSSTKGYKSFDNECFLYSENTCKYGDYKLAHDGECTKKELSMICLPEFCYKPGTPVCGYCEKSKKYFTFTNECYLNKENICEGKEYIKKHNGKCSDLELGGKCPAVCTLQLDYLCGHSPTYGYKTFNNKCFLDVENGCNGGDYKFLHKGECCKTELEKNCQLDCCLYSYQPICAVCPKGTLKEFPNMCSYIKEVSCYGADYKFLYGGVCKVPDVPPPPPPLPPADCNPDEIICTEEYNPVCVYSNAYNIFKTYPNKCYFERDSKCKPYYDLVFAHKKACSKEELEGKCPRSCSQEVAPVCAVSPTYGYKSFKNICTLLLQLSCYKSDYKFEHDGACTPYEAPLCKSGCNKYLPKDPVCAYSLSTKAFKCFENKCLWEYENQCAYGDYILLHAGQCTEPEKENDCHRLCTTQYEPVCGYSPTLGFKTFPNRCTFVRDLSCLGCDYVFYDEGKCKYPEGPQKDCPVVCKPDEKKPLCAFSSSTKSYKNYPNQCLLTAENQCNYGDYVFAHNGLCTPAETGHKCYRKCPLDYKPICCVHVTKGYRTFPSLCELEVANKCDGADYSIAHVGKCTIKELGGSCHHNCPLYYTGICGYSPVKGFKSFANECFMDRENTCTFSDYKLAHPGKCTPKEIGKICNHTCQLLFSPICAKSPTEGYKTFPNFCYMDRENSCSYCDYNFVHQNECFPWELCKNCKP